MAEKPKIFGKIDIFCRKRLFFLAKTALKQLFQSKTDPRKRLRKIFSGSVDDQKGSFSP